MNKPKRNISLSDPHLFHRVKEYVEVQETGTASVTDTVEYLRGRFPEYNRKQVAVLTKHVQTGIIIKILSKYMASN